MNEHFRLRIRFAKQARLRWLSHLELTRAMERLVRRSGLPYAVTSGFNRHMRFAPGPALPVGTAGLAELFDVWLTEYVPTAEAMALLRLAAGQALPIINLEYVPSKAKGLQATHTVGWYEVLFKAPGLTADDITEALMEACQGPIEVPHKQKAKAFDLPEVVLGSPEVVSVAGDMPGGLAMTCCILAGEQGSLRPDQLLSAVFGDAVEVASVTRTALEEPK
jgi:radical SAM-linked protein